MATSQNKVYELIVANQRMRGFPSLSNLFLKDPDLLPELVELSTSNLKHPFPEYASWLLSHVSKQAPDLVQPYYKKILPTVLITSNETVKRNLLGVVKYLPLMPFKEGELLSILLTWIADPSCKPAVFMYGMEIVINFCKKYPELYHEVEEIIKLRTTHPITPAIAATLKRFKKLGNVKKSKTKGS